MAAAEIHKDDIGTDFQISVKDGGTAVDLSTATTKDIIFGKPDGTGITHAASFLTPPGSDGVLRYKSVAGDLTPAGIWTLQASVVIPSSGTWKSDVHSFRVHDNV